MTKKIKVYKRRTHKFYGGQPVPLLTKKYDDADSYIEVIKKLEYNLNLLDESEGKAGFFRVSINGTFNYLEYMCINLQNRPKMDKVSEAEQVKKDLIVLKNNIVYLKEDYKDLKLLLERSDTLDSEIVFHFILGCIELLLIYIETIKSKIRLTGMETFTEFTAFFEYKIPRIQSEIVELKKIENSSFKKIGEDTIVPVKIKDNIEFYKLWRRNKTDPSITLKIGEVEKLLVPDPEVVQDKDGEVENK